MIYFPERKIAIITPPHTASQHTHKGLCRQPFDGIWVHGPDPYRNQIDHHYAKIQNSWKLDGVKTYLVVRNPYDRLIGLYLHYEWWTTQPDICIIPDGVRAKSIAISWDDNFLKIIRERDEHWIYSKTICQIMKDYNARYDEIIRYETLEEDLSDIMGQPVSLPPKYHNFNIIEDWYKDPNLLDYVNKTWSAEDCNRFGYDII